jgi:hypothetical protein
VFHLVTTVVSSALGGELTGLVWSRNSVVGITTAYRLDGRKVGVRVPVAARFFSMSSRPVLGPTQPLLSSW